MSEYGTLNINLQFFIWKNQKLLSLAQLFKTNNIVNVSLKFQTLISNIRQYFLSKKMWKAFAVQKLLLFFQQKHILVFGNKVVKHLTSSLS